MVKGKKEPEVIYAIAGREDTAQSGHFQRLRNLTIEMLACYRTATGKEHWRRSNAAARLMTPKRLSCSTISMRREFAAISKTRRRKIGTGPLRCSRNSPLSIGADVAVSAAPNFEL